MKKHGNNSRHLETVSEHADGLLVATAHIAEEKIVAARQRLTTALATAREFYENVEENVVSGAKRTDKFVREKPYHATAIALGAGALFGLWIARRKQS